MNAAAINNKIFSPRFSNYVINAESEPDYDDWGWDNYWVLADWVRWHKELVKKYGRTKDADGFEKADKIWLNAWAQQGWGASPVLAIATPSRFKEETDYLKKFPLIYQYSGLQFTMEGINPLDTSYKVTKAGFDLVDSAADTVSTLAKIAKVLIPVVIVGGVVFIGWYGYKKMSKKEA